MKNQALLMTSCSVAETNAASFIGSIPLRARQGTLRRALDGRVLI